MRTNATFCILLSLAALTACPHHGDTGDSDTSTETGTDTDTVDTSNPDDVGSAQVNTTFDGAQLDCFFNLDGTKKGTTNSLVSDIPTGTYDLSLGDVSDLSPDGIPIHDLGSGGMVIAPLDSIEIQKNKTTTVDKSFNRYIEGVWTCATSLDPDHPWHGEVTYEGGNQLTTGIFDHVTVDGESLSYSQDGVTKSGTFTSPTTLHMTSSGGMAGDYTEDCHAGN